MLQAALAADDRMIVIGTSHPDRSDTHLAGIELATGRTRWANPPVAPAHLIQFQSNSPFVSVALKDGHVIRLNALTGREQQRFLTDASDHWQPNPDPLGRPIFGKCTFNRDGSVFITAVKNSLQLWDVAEGKIKRATRQRIAEGWLYALAPDGALLAIADSQIGAKRFNNHIRLDDLKLDKPVLDLDAGDNQISVLAFSPDGSKLLSGFLRGSAIVWDVRQPTVPP